MYIFLRLGKTITMISKKKAEVKSFGEFPGGTVVSTQYSHCWGAGFDPLWEIKIPQALRCDQKKVKVLEDKKCNHKRK